MFSCFISVLLLPEEQHHQYHSSYLVLPRYPHTTSPFSAFSGSSSFCSCWWLQPHRPCCAIPQLLRPLISAFLGLFSPEFVATVADNRQSFRLRTVTEYVVWQTVIVLTNKHGAGEEQLPIGAALNLRNHKCYMLKWKEPGESYVPNLMENCSQVSIDLLSLMILCQTFCVFWSFSFNTPFTFFLSFYSSPLLLLSSCCCCCWYQIPSYRQPSWVRLVFLFFLLCGFWTERKMSRDTRSEMTEQRWTERGKESGEG